MSRHRAAPPPRYRTRHGRVVVLGLSLVTTAIALLGGVGVLPSAADDEPRQRPQARQASAEITDSAQAAAIAAEGVADEDGADEPADEAAAEPTEEPTEEATEEPTEPEADPEALPYGSGEGKRVVFSEAEQRVWLVGSAGNVRRTYAVSGSLEDNLDPGTYEVYSRSEDAIGIDGTQMRLFVRFTQGPSGAAIGFHTIPTDPDNGDRRVQTVAELGTPRSHGCIRQATPDAREMWDFAREGTTVVVV